MSKKERFEELLRSYEVTKYWTDINLEAEEPCGLIKVNVDSYDLILDIYKMYTKDTSGLVAEGQFLGILYDDFTEDEEFYDGIFVNLK